MFFFVLSYLQNMAFLGCFLFHWGLAMPNELQNFQEGDPSGCVMGGFMSKYVPFTLMVT